MKDIIFNGVPWFDQNGNTVNAHGACIVREHDTYYLFGEYKTDDKNMYNGFSCYSSKNHHIKFAPVNNKAIVNYLQDLMRNARIHILFRHFSIEHHFFSCIRASDINKQNVHR